MEDPPHLPTTEEEKEQFAIIQARVHQTIPKARPTTSTSAASATTDESRQPPIPNLAKEPTQKELDQMLRNKKTSKIPPTPSIPSMPTRLQLNKNNFKIKDQKQPDAYYELLLLQETIRRSYIQYYPTSRYHKATDEINTFFDKFDIHNWHN
eukprot:2223276-Amphidinium_carterae.1